MTAESAQRFDALERQAERIMAVFASGGYERVAPAILQPAGIFLDRVGEDIRSRAYVFTDQDGNELCLRPDLTIPVCRVYLDRHPDAEKAARYSYNGPAFRYQSGAPHPLRPREFRQAGIENFGATDPLPADMETLALTYEALREAGLSNPRLRIGDVGLFRAFISAMEMPERWRARVIAAFSRGDALTSVLHDLTRNSAKSPSGKDADLLAMIDPADPAQAEKALAAHIEGRGFEIVGARTLTEVAARLMELRADSNEAPLPAENAQLIQSFATLECPALEACANIAALGASCGLGLEAPLEDLNARIESLAGVGLDPAQVIFSTSTGRRFEYYTGFTFEFSYGEIPAPIASGGRYDGLIAALGGASTPAVGAAIYTERLLGAVERGAP